MTRKKQGSQTRPLSNATSMSDEIYPIALSVPIDPERVFVFLSFAHFFPRAGTRFA
jgi:hypothetical protein